MEVLEAVGGRGGGGVMSRVFCSLVVGIFFLLSLGLGLGMGMGMGMGDRECASLLVCSICSFFFLLIYWEEGLDASLYIVFPPTWVVWMYV